MPGEEDLPEIVDVSLPASPYACVVTLFFREREDAERFAKWAEAKKTGWN